MNVLSYLQPRDVRIQGRRVAAPRNASLFLRLGHQSLEQAPNTSKHTVHDDMFGSRFYIRPYYNMPHYFEMRIQPPPPPSTYVCIPHGREQARR